MKVEWDEPKNTRNTRDHGISFDEASNLFLLETDYLEIFDESHSEREDRFLAIGPIARGIILVVWNERDEDVVRIISARMATKNEQQKYAEYMVKRT